VKVRGPGSTEVDQGFAIAAPLQGHAGSRFLQESVALFDRASEHYLGGNTTRYCCAAFAFELSMPTAMLGPSFAHQHYALIVTF
jgi:hypothetical protein